MEPWLWSAILMLLAMGLVVMELFIPSGGILGFLAACSVVGAIFLSFQNYENYWVGLGFVALAVVGTPIVMVVAIKYWPETSIGKAFLPAEISGDDVLPDNQQLRLLRSLEGQVGITKSMMLPSGGVRIDGRTIDAMSEGMPIEEGQLVRVIKVSGSHVVVRPLDPEEVTEHEEGQHTVNPDDVLSQNVEDFGLDSLDEPLG
jgi:membrane-bound ClpP family serine protease